MKNFIYLSFSTILLFTYSLNAAPPGIPISPLPNYQCVKNDRIVNSIEFAQDGRPAGPIKTPYAS